MIKLNDLILLLSTLMLFLLGCVHTQRPLQISCFASEDANKAKQPVEGQGPLIINKGEAIFYDADGSLRRVKDATCGVIADE